jgi:cell fate regulator YaaT (PSP1 superfamily)
MAIIIGVRFREVGRVYHFDPGDKQVKKGDRVIVETARGIECGEVMLENTEIPDEQITHPLKMLIRVATPEDLTTVQKKAEKEADAFRIGEEKIKKHKLDMKLVNVEYTFDASRIIFHFTADERVDFRELVKDLAGVFRTRIELRQIGVRDEAKLLGGLGICGRPFCCSSFMGDFQPVSIKMAKEQNLSLNPVKISGTCGRLMCCLKYEQEAYEHLLRDLPKVGASVDTPEGRGTVLEINAISGMVKVRLEQHPDVPVSFQMNRETKTLQRVERNLERSPVLADNSLRSFAPLAESLGAFLDPFDAAEDPPPAEKGPDRPRNNRQGQKNNASKRPPNKSGQSQEKNNNFERKGNNSSDSPRGNGQKNNSSPKDNTQRPRQQPNTAKQPRPGGDARPAESPRPNTPPPAPAADIGGIPRYGAIRRANNPQNAPAAPSQERRGPAPWQKNRRDAKGPPPPESPAAERSPTGAPSSEGSKSGHKRRRPGGKGQGSDGQ